MGKIAHRRITRVHNVEDARKAARRVLPRAVFDFVDGAAEDEITMRANRQGFEELSFRQRAAVCVPTPDLSTSVGGRLLALPVLLAPCGSIRTVHPGGETAVARAACAAGTVSVLSTASATPLEAVAAGASAPLWFQLYFLGGRRRARMLIDRVAAAGYEGLMLTIDSGTVGNREPRDTRNGVRYPVRADFETALRMAPQVAMRPHWLYQFLRDGAPLGAANVMSAHAGDTPHTIDPVAANSLFAEPPVWDDLGWIREQWDGPLFVKGVLSAQDARRAVDCGADGVVVSNHGGRQLDSTPATIRVLPEVVAAVGTEAEVLLDSGVRRGSDIAKAVALGARAVLVGRPYVYGLAIAGELGVSRIIEVLRSELERTMVLLGCPSVQALDTTWVSQANSFK